MAAGWGEEIDGSKYDWSWNDPAVAGPAWVAVASPIRESIYPTANKAHSADVGFADNVWGLVPDTLPAMEFSPTDAGKIVLSGTDFTKEPSSFISSRTIYRKSCKRPGGFKSSST